MINKVKNTVPWTYVISDLKGEEIVGMFYEKKQKKEFRVESSFNSWIYKKNLL